MVVSLFFAVGCGNNHVSSNATINSIANACDFDHIVSAHALFLAISSFIS